MTPTGHGMGDVCIGPTPTAITWSLSLLDTELLYQVSVIQGLYGEPKHPHCLPPWSGECGGDLGVGREVCTCAEMYLCAHVSADSCRCFSLGA